MSKRLYCTFHLDRLSFGIDVLTIQEVLRPQKMQTVPHAPDIVRGLINLRGQIVTAIDLRRRLALPQSTSDEPPMSIVVRSEGAPVSLLVDGVGDILELDDADASPPPETLRGQARELVDAVFKLDGSLLLILDVARVLQVRTAAS